MNNVITSINNDVKREANENHIKEYFSINDLIITERNKLNKLFLLQPLELALTLSCYVIFSFPYEDFSNR